MVSLAYVVFFCILVVVGAKSEISSELKQLLQDITPNFEENLRRAFVNEGVRTQSLRNRGNEDSHSLTDALVEWEGTTIELRKVTFPWRPDFRINKLSVDLAMSSVDIVLNLGNLRVEAEYEANNRSLQKVLPVSHIGKISFTLENVSAYGKVGLIIKEDSILPQTYDMHYEPSEVLLRVNYYNESENLVENELGEQTIESTLVKTFWVELTETITNLLHRQLSAVIVEFSVTELLADNDTELREHIRQQETKANRLLDSLLCSAKDYLVAENSRSIETPPFGVVFKGKPTEVHRGNFATKPGYIQDLATLTRVQDMNLYEDAEKIVVYGYISLREFKHGYEKYHCEYVQTRIQGSIRATIYRNKIFVKLSMLKSKEECVPRLETVQIRFIKDIDMDVSGLASLTWLTQQVGSWLLGNLRNRALPVLEKHITEAFERALKNTDCANLLVD